MRIRTQNKEITISFNQNTEILLEYYVIITNIKKSRPISIFNKDIDKKQRIYKEFCKEMVLIEALCHFECYLTWLTGLTLCGHRAATRGATE